VSKTDTSAKYSEDTSYPPGQTSQVYQYRKSPGSTPELSLQSTDDIPRSGAFPSSLSHSVSRRYGRLLTADLPDPIAISADAPDAFNTQTIKSSSVPHMSSDAPAEPMMRHKRDERKHKFLGLGRKGSMKRVDDRSSRNRDEVPLKTAPLGQERGFRDMMNSSLRNHSADRYNDKNESSDDNTSVAASSNLRPKASTRAHVRDAAEMGQGLLMSFGNRAADGFGRAGKALAKLGRTGSGHDRDLPPSVPRQPHTLTIIKLPLIEQTRITRISKRLEHSRDKTEFWMPALPWRCIDYLNAKGIESEGIYRVPGSTREVEHWEMRFDTEHDIDLLQPDIPIYDINTVASIFKNWLRNLPDEIVPSTVQNEVIKAVSADGGSLPLQAPKELKKALSQLPPFNYYLLFAITCHLSLLNAHSEVTKMTYNNLRICLQPSLRLSPPFFQWLVEDWRNCWEGCFPEKEYLEREYRWIEQAELAAAQHHQRAGSSSKSSQDRTGARSVTPGGNWNEREVEREKERPKTSHKDSKTNLSGGNRTTQHFDKFPLPPQNQPQQQHRGGSNASSGTIRPATSHVATSSTSLDASPVPPMPAMPKQLDKDDANRQISSSDSSKPSVMSYDGRSTPEQFGNTRDVSSPPRQQQQAPSTTSSRNGSRTPRKESSRSRERQGRDREGNQLRLRNEHNNPEHQVSSTAHITSAMKTDSRKTSDNSVRKASDKEENSNNNREQREDNAQEASSGKDLGAAEKRKSLKAPQISPMKPMSPMGSMDLTGSIDLELHTP
jgi:hypothetical protein